MNIKKYLKNNDIMNLQQAKIIANKKKIFLKDWE
jgi:hypothetical protein